jgi:hypothetical protein
MPGGELLQRHGVVWICRSVKNLRRNRNGSKASDSTLCIEYRHQKIRRYESRSGSNDQSNNVAALTGSALFHALILEFLHSLLITSHHRTQLKVRRLEFLGARV